MSKRRETRRKPMKLKNPIREIRKAMTPPCTQCVHSCFKAFNSVTILCKCGAYLDHVERTCCERYDNFRCKRRARNQVVPIRVGTAEVRGR